MTVIVLVSFSPPHGSVRASRGLLGRGGRFSCLSLGCLGCRGCGGCIGLGCLGRVLGLLQLRLECGHNLWVHVAFGRRRRSRECIRCIREGRLGCLGRSGRSACLLECSRGIRLRLLECGRVNRGCGDDCGAVVGLVIAAGCGNQGEGGQGQRRASPASTGLLSYVWIPCGVPLLCGLNVSDIT